MKYFLHQIKKHKQDVILVLALAAVTHFALWQADKIYDLKQELKQTKMMLSLKDSKS